MGQVRGSINGKNIDGSFQGKVHLKPIEGGLKTLYLGTRRVITYRAPKMKWSLEEKEWNPVEGDDSKKAISIVTFNENFGKKRDENPSAEYEYFLIMEGMRPENYPKTGGNTAYGSKHVLSQLETIDANFKVGNILVDNDAPLEKQAEFVAEHIERLKKDGKCKKIHVLGVSKCGTMSVAMLKYLSDEYLDKLNVMTYSAPFLGTILASPEILYKRLEKIAGNVEAKLLEGVVRQLMKILPVEFDRSKLISLPLIEIIKSIHWNIFSQSAMDYDISLFGGIGVPEKHKDRYDALYLKNMFGEKTLERLKKVSFTNITTTCTEQTRKNAIKSGNVTAGMLYLAAKVLMTEPSDGMVTQVSAREIERVCAVNGIEINKLPLPDGHHDLLKDSNLLAQIINPRVLYPEMHKVLDER